MTKLPKRIFVLATVFALLLVCFMIASIPRLLYHETPLSAHLLHAFKVNSALGIQPYDDQVRLAQLGPKMLSERKISDVDFDYLMTYMTIPGKGKYMPQCISFALAPLDDLISAYPDCLSSRQHALIKHETETLLKTNYRAFPLPGEPIGDRSGADVVHHWALHIAKDIHDNELIPYVLPFVNDPNRQIEEQASDVIKSYGYKPTTK